jgi:hypothetical protein
MAKYVTNPQKYAGSSYSENSLRTTQARRMGEWGRVPPELNPANRSLQLRQAKTEALRSGRYFPNNVVEKTVERNRRSVESFMARKQAIDSQK